MADKKTYYNVFLISNDGEGKVHNLPQWDGEEPLELHLNVFARDAVISIEPDLEVTDDA